MLSILDRHDPTLPSAIAILRKKYGDVFIVHRIDKDTSGCLVFAKNENAHRHASIAFETRQVTKKYLGIVHGAPPQDSGTIKDKIMDHPVINVGMGIVNYDLFIKIFKYNKLKKMMSEDNSQLPPELDWEQMQDGILQKMEKLQTPTKAN